LHCSSSRDPGSEVVVFSRSHQALDDGGTRGHTFSHTWISTPFAHSDLQAAVEAIAEKKKPERKVRYVMTGWEIHRLTFAKHMGGAGRVRRTWSAVYTHARHVQYDAISATVENVGEPQIATAATATPVTIFFSLRAGRGMVPCRSSPTGISSTRVVRSSMIPAYGVLGPRRSSHA
jgi:hypothetical protein